MSAMSPVASRSRRLLPLGLLLVVALAAMACGGGGDDDDEPVTTTTTSTLPTMPADFQWWDPSPTPLGQGWVLRRCTVEIGEEADDTKLCFDHPDGRHGIIRLYRFLAPDDGDLNAHAGRFVDDFVADRKEGCGEEYLVKAEPIVALEANGGRVVRYGFSGAFAGSPTTERTVQWAGIRGEALEIMTLSAYDPGSCVVPNGEATLDAVDEVVPGLDALITASGLHGPDPTP
jgi:hypothetical protein